MSLCFSDSELVRFLVVVGMMFLSFGVVILIAHYKSKDTKKGGDKK